MIKYHGPPVTPALVFYQVLQKKNCLVSWANSQDLKRAFETCKKIMLDNGAFTFWKNKKKVDWLDYYKWVFDDYNYECIDYFIIPDIIDGSERENDKLIFQYQNLIQHLDVKNKGIPVWHLHESFIRLNFLIENFDYIAIGSSGEYTELGTRKWHIRMNEVMKIVCDRNGIPKVKIHMLRCLNAVIFTLYPFYSGDSTNLARNHLRDGWKSILQRIEKYNSPQQYKFKRYYETRSMF